MNNQTNQIRSSMYQSSSVRPKDPQSEVETLRRKLEVLSKENTLIRAEIKASKTNKADDVNSSRVSVQNLENDLNSLRKENAKLDRFRKDVRVG
jgi:hypothetical protein